MKAFIKCLHCGTRLKVKHTRTYTRLRIREYVCPKCGNRKKTVEKNQES